MSEAVEIEFRGEKAVVIIDYDGGVDWDTGTRDLEWHFRGLGVSAHEALGLTTEERDDVFQQIERQLG